MTSRIPTRASHPDNDENKDNGNTQNTSIETDNTILDTTIGIKAPRSVFTTNTETLSEPGDTSDPTDVAAEADPGDPDQDIDPPLPMAASVVLSSLPGDTKRALGQAVTDAEAVAGAGGSSGKVTIRFHPIGSAPRLTQRVYKIAASQRFTSVIRFLRRKLGLRDTESVFCYVNSVFAPGLDEGVGNLWRCFKVKNELVVTYSITPAFG